MIRRGTARVGLALAVMVAVGLMVGAAVVAVVAVRAITELASPPRERPAVRVAMSTNPIGDHPRDRHQILETLEWQAQALLAGDEMRWLSPVHPGRDEVLRIYRKQFTVLRLLGVVGFQPLIGHRGLPDADPSAIGITVPVSFVFCVQTTDCLALDRGAVYSRENEKYTAELTWTWYEPYQRLVITAFELVPESRGSLIRDRFPPWLTDEVSIGVGSKVVVVAPAAVAGDIDRVVAIADRAAADVARFVRWTVPARYVIYLAGAQEWDRWYGPWEPRGSWGYVSRIARTAAPIVVNYTATSQAGLADVLRHEIWSPVRAAPVSAGRLGRRRRAVVGPLR